MRTIRYACHTAILDDMTGEGLLVLPLPEDDLGDPTGGMSLHAVDGTLVLAALDALGWEPTEGDGGDPWCHVGYLPDGREVVGLYGREPITTVPCLEQSAEALAELRSLAGL